MLLIIFCSYNHNTLFIVKLNIMLPSTERHSFWSAAENQHCHQRIWDDKHVSTPPHHTSSNFQFHLFGPTLISSYPWGLHSLIQIPEMQHSDLIRRNSLNFLNNLSRHKYKSLDASRKHAYHEVIMNVTTNISLNEWINEWKYVVCLFCKLLVCVCLCFL